MTRTKGPAMLAALLLAVFSLCDVAIAESIPIGIKEVVYQPGALLDPTSLTGTVLAVYNSATKELTLEIRNTTESDASGSLVLLTGFGFSLPTGVTITGGKANITSDPFSVAVGFSETDVSNEWGWDGSKTPFAAGAYLQGGTVNASVATLVMGGATQQFASGSIDEAKGLNGPSFGLISRKADPGGLPAIMDSITIALNLNVEPSYKGDLLKDIGAGHTVLAYGSPEKSTVPEPGTLLLLGVGMISLYAVRKRR